MILTHGANSLARGGGGQTVNIGGKDYPYVEIDGKLWITKNLDFIWSGLTVGDTGSPTTPAANYYGNDESTYGWNGKQCGLLYNYEAYTALRDGSLLPDGWRVAHYYDFFESSLFDFVGENAAQKLKALDNSVGGNWPTVWNGTDLYGFDALPSGYSLSGSSFGGIGEYWYLWNDPPNNSDRNWLRFAYNSTTPYRATNGSWGYSIRLVKDAT